MKRMLVVPALFLALCLRAAPAMCGQTVPCPPPPMFFKGPGPVAMLGDAQFLYVIAGGKLLEYNLDKMTTLAHSVDLPGCRPPDDRQVAKAPHPPRDFPPPPPPLGLWVGNGRVYVLAGPAIHVYQAPGLTLVNTVELPGAKPPREDQAH